MTHTSNTTKALRGLIALVALSAMLALPATASAQAIGAGDDCTPTDSQYAPPTDVLECDDVQGGGDEGGEVAGLSASGEDPVEASGDELPFTGLDAMTLLAVAAALTGTGLVLRRLTSPGGGRS
jgi:hypothetical protein